MADTTFVNGVTLTDEDWFNDVNRLHYTLLGDPSTTASVASAIAPSISTLGALASVSGNVIATQAQMESAVSAGAASTSLIVTPARLQYHPGVAKAWVRFDGTATSVTSGAGYNISSITDKGTGNYNIIFSTPFSSANFAPLVNGNLYNVKLTSVSAASVEVTCVDLSGTAADASIVTLIAYGDQ